MPNTIKVGTLLTKQGAILPEALRFESEPCAAGWSFVLDADGLARKIQEAGWIFFYMAGEIKATAFGFDGQGILRTAIGRILAKLKPEECNSLEITAVTSKRFLGLPYTSVTAHARHIQEGLSLFQPRGLPEWPPQRRIAA